MKITEPGIYYDLDAKVYHAQHDWLSSSGMKKLLRPSCPAKFKAAMTAREERRSVFDFGKVFHTRLLGDGDEFEVVQALTKQKKAYPARDYTTKSAQDHRDAIYEAGKVPILAHELEHVEAMVAAVKAHPVAAALFAKGRPEVSLFWVDEATGVKCRARLDWLPEKVAGRRLIVPDLKSAASSEPGKFSKAAADYGYHQQQDHYLDGIRATGLDDDPAFLFVVAEKDPPHVVTVGQFAQPDDLRLATAMNDRARRVFRECAENDHWPGYVEGIASLELPAYYHYQNEEFVA